MLADGSVYLFVFGAGIFAWSLMEYGIHGVLAHRLRTFVTPMHGWHHREPRAVFTSPLAWIPVAVSLWGFLALLVGAVWSGVAVVCSVLLVVVWFVVLHGMVVCGLHVGADAGGVDTGALLSTSLSTRANANGTMRAHGIGNGYGNGNGYGHGGGSMAWSKPDHSFLTPSSHPSFAHGSALGSLGHAATIEAPSMITDTTHSAFSVFVDKQ